MLMVMVLFLFGVFFLVNGGFLNGGFGGGVFSSIVFGGGGLFFDVLVC